MQNYKNILAIECSTDTLSIALQAGDQRWSEEHVGGAQASAKVLGLLEKLLAQAKLAWADVNVFTFGRGPGAFTGVRVACAVAQGLSVAQALPLMPLSGLLAIAEEARQKQIATQGLAANAALQVLAVQDARMAQAYTAECVFDGQSWSLGAERLLAYADVQTCPANFIAAGNVRAALHAAGLEDLSADFIDAMPRAASLLRVAQQYLAQGKQPINDAALALPTYVRDKVAQTTAERLLAKQGV